MNSQLFIPQKIKVGYQHRTDTYTQKLAYVIYYDAKGTLRKETSWDGWRDKKIEANDFENVPTEGFVLNKKAGGYSSGWNHRATYCRVYDPRGFEFEITIPNLLFILQESNAYKGKGLEGEFVYSWDGKDLVLLPACSEDYKKSNSFTKLQEGKVSSKELVPGCTYRTKKQENLIYMGKFMWYESPYYSGGKIIATHSYVFSNTNGAFSKYSSLSHLASKTSDVSVNNFASLMESLNKDKHMLSIKQLSCKKININFGHTKYDDYHHYYRNSYKRNYDEQKTLNPTLEGYYATKISENQYRIFTIVKKLERIPNGGDFYGNKNYVKEIGFKLESSKTVSLENNQVSIKASTFKDDTNYTKNQINAMEFFSLELQLNNGSTKKLDFN